jgi:hypothetical protein
MPPVDNTENPPVMGFMLNGKFVPMGANGNMGGYGNGNYGNMFGSGQFGSYFGGGVPPASSGFRYRNKRNQLNTALKAMKVDPNADPEKIKDLGNELGDLKAARNAYMAAGIASALPGVVGNVAALANNYRAYKDLKKANPDDYISQELRNIAGSAGQAAASASVSDRGQRISDINAAGNTAFQDASVAATSPDQVIKTAMNVQRNKNNAFNQMGSEGVRSQAERKRYRDSLNMKIGDMRQNVKNEIEKQKSTLRGDMIRQGTGLLDTAVTGGLTAGI